MQQGNPTSLRVPDPGIEALFEQDSRWQAWLVRKFPALRDQLWALLKDCSPRFMQAWGLAGW